MFQKVAICFFFLISTNKPSMSFGKLCFVKSLPPPIRFQSSRKGTEKPSIRMLDVVNVSSSFFRSILSYQHGLR